MSRILGVTEPVCRPCWACALAPGSLSCRAHTLQRPKAAPWSPTKSAVRGLSAAADRTPARRCWRTARAARRSQHSRNWINKQSHSFKKEYTWRRKWQPTPVLLPGKFHGWRSLVGYSPWCGKESDTTTSLFIIGYWNSRVGSQEIPGITG